MRWTFVFRDISLSIIIDKHFSYFFFFILPWTLSKMDCIFRHFFGFNLWRTWQSPGATAGCPQERLSWPVNWILQPAMFLVILLLIWWWWWWWECDGWLGLFSFGTRHSIRRHYGWFNSLIIHNFRPVGWLDSWMFNVLGAVRSEFVKDKGNAPQMLILWSM